LCVESGHDHADAHRRHLQPGHLLRGSELKPNLLDYISETVDPTTGFAHIAYADDKTVNKLRVANQTAGPTILGH
jgi:hypothetical protein